MTKRLIPFIVLLFASNLIFSQTLKIGHINSSKVLELMPEVKTAKTQLEAVQKEYEAQLDVLITEYRTKLEDYQAKSATMTAILKKDKETEIVQLENRIKAFQEDAAEDMQTKEMELMKPILEKLQNVITEVAKENKYDYILDTAGGTVLYSKDGDDITALVKKKLGIQ